jgi:hypothetical protein
MIDGPNVSRITRDSDAKLQAPLEACNPCARHGRVSFPSGLPEYSDAAEHGSVYRRGSNLNRPSRSALQQNGPTPSYMYPPPSGRRHFISHDEAAGLLRTKPPKITQRGGHFPRSVFDEILAQPDCAGVRFYFGCRMDGSLAMVLVGMTSDEQDMTTGLIAEDFFPCPPFCDATSALIR